MNFVEWKQEYCTGIASVDREHRDLIELINTLHASLDHDTTQDQVVTVLNEVYEQMVAHFANEEALMQDAMYPAFAEHKLDHETLLDDMREIMNSITEEWRDSTSDLAVDLDRWFSDHFRVHDAKLHKLLK
ncbi:MAG TPA: hemerythrin family protein [Woeseiaceae bacterium]|nr:hemerythrin family protein [Woeseiaceae bacterium]